ncbi:unnamed protein product [Caenorhabditis sp. 36 PRJEB53466]|nr:unnamed protein product [Caenorhabditis sp. 36 PRJEB53466]
MELPDERHEIEQEPLSREKWIRTKLSTSVKKCPSHLSRNETRRERKAKRRGIDTAVTPPIHESQACFNFEDGVSYIACIFTYNNMSFFSYERDEDYTITDF